MNICRIRNCFLLGLFAAMSPVMAHAATITEATVGVYDEPVQTNAVDATAPGSIAVGAFTTDVAVAWASDFGGVIQFDGSSTIFAIDTIDATYGTSQTKTLRITNGEASVGWAAGGADHGGGRTSISGEGRIGKDGGFSNDFFFDIGPITGGDAGEAVLSIGVTVLSRDTKSFNIDVTATFDDNSTSMLSDVVAGAAGADDTFFAIAAPAGRSIVKLVVLNNTSFASLDDLAFITGVPVPEPSSLILLSIGTWALLAFRRRRAA